MKEIQKSSGRLPLLLARMMLLMLSLNVAEEVVMAVIVMAFVFVVGFGLVPVCEAQRKEKEDRLTGCERAHLKQMEEKKKKIGALCVCFVYSVVSVGSAAVREEGLMWMRMVRLMLMLMLME